MAENNITFVRGQGGLGRPLSGKDYVSGFVAYLTDGNLPSGFGTSDRIKNVFSIEEVEALGIIEGSATLGTIWYHLDQYFKKQPKGDLYIGLFDSVAIDYSVIETVQTFANGEIRQIAIYDLTTFATGTVDTIQTSVDALKDIDQPLNVIYTGDISAVVDLSTLTDLKALSDSGVSVDIGQDGAGAGAALFISEATTIGSTGALLGTVSLSSVHENVGWVLKFDVTDGVEFSQPAFGNGDLYRDISQALKDGINGKGYIYIRTIQGQAGAFYNDSFTAISETSDFSTIENNRTIDKAVRGIRTLLLPLLNSPLYVTANGTLTEDVIADFESRADSQLKEMARLGEISPDHLDVSGVSIDPGQDVLATSQIELAVSILPVGVARQIKVNIGFTTKLV